MYINFYGVSVRRTEQWKHFQLVLYSGFQSAGLSAALAANPNLSGTDFLERVSDFSYREISKFADSHAENRSVLYTNLLDFLEDPYEVESSEFLEVFCAPFGFIYLRQLLKQVGVLGHVLQSFWHPAK